MTVKDLPLADVIEYLQANMSKGWSTLMQPASAEVKTFGPCSAPARRRSRFQIAP